VSCVHVLVVCPGCGHRGFGDPKADGVRTAMVIRTAMVVRTANQRATIQAAIRAAVKRGDVRPVEEEAIVRKYKRSMV
jgi:hypothetical protein